jgi:hypothetical protein
MNSRYSFCCLALAVSVPLVFSAALAAAQTSATPASLSSASKILSGSTANNISAPMTRPKITGTRLPIAFEPNRGQFVPRVRFAGHAEGALILFTDQGVEVELTEPGTAFSKSGVAADLRTVQLTVEKMGADAKPVGIDKLEGKVNYLVGRDSSRWIRDLETYRRVQYTGGDLGLVFYGNDDGALEYDLIVPPGSNPDSIHLRVQGADRTRLDGNGDLIISVGKRAIRQKRPVAYTRSAQGRQPVQVGYVLRKHGEIGFRVARFDRRSELVIDPALIYSSFLGGAGFESEALGIAADSSGNTYVIGSTSSPSFPITPGVVDPSCNLSTSFPGCSAGTVGFVTKINPAGTAIIYSTFLGGRIGAVNEGRGAIAVGADGSAYVVGILAPPDGPGEPAGDFQFWPLPPIQSQPPCQGSQISSTAGITGFFVKLSPDGTTLEYATLLDFASPFSTFATAVALDGTGNAYVSGFRTSFDTIGNSGTQGFVVRIDPTQCGPGSLMPHELGAPGKNTRALSVALDASGNTYVTGSTDDPNFPTTSSPIQSTPSQSPTCISQCTKAFVMKLAPDGTQLLSNYLATNTGHGDVAWGIVVDNAGEPTIVGTTTAFDLPLQNPFQKTCNDVVNGGICAFVTKFNSPFSALQWSTYLSGSSTSQGLAIAADAANNVYVTGVNQAADFPVGPPFPSNGCTLQNPSFGTCGGLFVTSFSPSGQIVYSFLADGDSVGLAITSDPQANIYVAGETSATATDFRVFPAPSNASPAFPEIFPGVPGNGFVLKLGPNQPADTSPPNISCGTPDGLWHPTDVTIACTATDSGSGLANPADASFTLSTNVLAGTETANAATNSHMVCDQADNCATAGPISGNMVDKKPPSITITSPSNGGHYIVNTSVIANYSCADGGSGVATCVGPVASGVAASTNQVGIGTFTVNSADAVGNASFQSEPYIVTYGICLLYDPTKAKSAGSTVPIKFFFCDANGGDVSSAAIVVAAVSLSPVATSVLLPIDSTQNPNSADANFRFASDLVSGGGYIFNLSTSGLSPGTYKLTIRAGADPLTHDLFFQLR